VKQTRWNCPSKPSEMPFENASPMSPHDTISVMGSFPLGLNTYSIRALRWPDVPLLEYNIQGHVRADPRNTAPRLPTLRFRARSTGIWRVRRAAIRKK
jgi:hypothetical protein